MNNFIYEYINFLIQSKNVKLSEIDLLILAAIKNEKIDILNSTTNDISKALFLSKSAITRFAQKLGFNGFSDFKYKLKSEEINTRHSLVDLSYKQVIDNLNSLPEEIINLIYRLDSYRKVCVFGIGSSGIAAKEYNYRLNESGLSNVHFADEPYNLFIESNKLNEKDLVLALSISGENDNLIDNVKLAIDKGACIWGISAKRKSKLEKLSDYFLQVPYPTKSISKIIPLIYLLDLICYYLQNSQDIH
ncbi:MAG: MurR/RpiR family transcriptional regulator [Peptoniphilaceae bacterium]|nr:MurR/RpiR family transcriptional regulator [Peptoniphilaceae bacterium]MDY6019256.1 MurR/RpiR family transcriptional regulator [Anaerococcus sp.]